MNAQTASILFKSSLSYQQSTYGLVSTPTLSLCLGLLYPVDQMFGTLVGSYGTYVMNQSIYNP